MGASKYTREERRQIVEEIEHTGETNASAAKRYKVDRSTVGQWRRAEGYPPRRREKWATNERVDQAAEMYERGDSLRDVAEAMGVCHQTIYYWLRLRGVATRSNWPAEKGKRKGKRWKSKRKS